MILQYAVRCVLVCSNNVISNQRSSAVRQALAELPVPRQQDDNPRPPSPENLPPSSPPPRTPGRARPATPTAAPRRGSIHVGTPLGQVRLAYLRSPAFLARALDALVGADARPQALLALAPLTVMLAYLRSPAFLHLSFRYVRLLICQQLVFRKHAFFVVWV